MFSKWLGETEEGLRQIFRIARQVAPTVIFFDQLDSIAPVRGVNVGSMTTDRVVGQLLAELDGVEDLSRVIILGATNRIDLIDPAVLRPGRFGIHIHVGMPEEDSRKEILRIGLEIPKIRDENEIEKIVEIVAPLTDGFSGARIRELADAAKRRALKRTGFTKVTPPSLDDLLALLNENNSKNMEGETNG